MARSTRRDDWPARESEGGRVVLALVLGLALLAGGAYAAAYLAAGDKIPVGTTVAGVDVGGHDATTAADVLRDGLQSRADTPFTVVIDGHSQQVRPAQVGLAVDYAASVGKAGAPRSWRPSHLWRYYTQGSSYDPVVTLDQDRLAALLRRLDESDGRTPRDGAVTFRHGSVQVRSPRPGLTLDPRAAGMAFWNAYLTGDPTVQLQLTPVAPAVDSAAIDHFVKHFANPAMASDVVLHFATADVRLSPSDYAHLLVARRVGNRLRPTVRRPGLTSLTRADLSDATLDRPQPATVALVGGRPHVVAARAGVRFRSRDVAAALLHAITSPHRTARVRPTTAPASFTTADARHLGIRHELASYAVPLAGAAHGATLAAAVSSLDGTVLKPGRSWSVRHGLGDATPSGTGGDALATALFNAAWLGGIQVPTHAAEASYSGTAPLGRDATLRAGHDLTIRDDTRYGVLVSAADHHGTLTVTLWSDPRWQVTSRHGPRTHVVAAGRHVDDSPGCTPSTGRPGFEVTVTRSFAHGGHVVRTSSYTVRYRPMAAVVCRGDHQHGQHGHHHH